MSDFTDKSAARLKALLAEKMPGGFGSLYSAAEGYLSLDIANKRLNAGIGDREVVCVLFRLWGYSYADIASIIGVGSAERVRQIVAKAGTRMFEAIRPRIEQIVLKADQPVSSDHQTE